MARLKYTGNCPSVEVGGHGHFAPGEEKEVDMKTALDMDQPHPKSEGWEVTYEAGERKKVAEDDETSTSAQDRSPRGPRTHRNDDTD
jgi:hypothetical protein